MKTVLFAREGWKRRSLVILHKEEISIRILRSVNEQAEEDAKKP
jgi:hypothetical protein